MQKIRESRERNNTRGEGERNNNINSLISGQIRGRPWAPDTRCAWFLLLKCHLGLKDIADWKIRTPTEWKYGELSEPRKSRITIGEYKAVTRRGMNPSHPRGSSRWQLTAAQSKFAIDSANKGIDGIWEGRALSRPFYMAATERGPPNISTPFVAETIKERSPTMSSDSAPSPKATSIRSWPLSWRTSSPPPMSANASAGTSSCRP